MHVLKVCVRACGQCVERPRAFKPWSLLWSQMELEITAAAGTRLARQVMLERDLNCLT